VSRELVSLLLHRRSFAYSSLPEIPPKDIWKVVGEHKAEYDALTAEEKDKLVQELDEHKATQKKSRWSSNKSKGNNVTHTFGRITNKVCFSGRWEVMGWQHVLLAPEPKIADRYGDDAGRCPRGKQSNNQ